MSTDTTHATGMNVAMWNDDQRRNGSMVTLGIAVAVALGALAVWWFLASTPAWVYWLLVGVLVLVLLFMLALIVMKPRAKAAEAESAVAMSSDAEPAQAPAAAFEPRVLTLRCGDCGTIFDVTDTGERPLYHTCPGCGAEGALRDPVAPEAQQEQAAPEEYAAPEPAPYAPTPAAAPPVEAAPPPPPVKKLKLRCGGCKEIFSIEDSGERPLRRACPHCGRMGQVN